MQPVNGSRFAGQPERTDTVSSHRASPEQGMLASLQFSYDIGRCFVTHFSQNSVSISQCLFSSGLGEAMRFEKSFVINLAFKTERLAKFQSSVPACLAPVEVWRAIHGDTVQHPDWWTAGRGAWGC